MPTTVTLRECVSLIVQCLKGLEKGSDVSFRVCKQEDSTFDLYLNQKLPDSENVEVLQDTTGEPRTDLSQVTLSEDSFQSTSKASMESCLKGEYTNNNNNVEITSMTDDQDDGAIIIVRTPFKDQNSGQPRSASRSASLKRKHMERLEEIQEKLMKPSKPRKNPVIEDDSENEINDPKELEDDDDQEIVIERSGRKPSRRISKLENRKLEQQMKVQNTLSNTAEKPKLKFVSDDESESEDSSKVKEPSVEKPVSSNKRKLVFDSQTSSVSENQITGNKRKRNEKQARVARNKDSDNDEDLMIVKENDEDASEAESLDFIDDENVGQEDTNSRSSKPDWQKELHKVIDSSAKMTRSSETEISVFCKVLHIYLTAAAFPGRSYPLLVTDSFKQYPPEKATNLRKCLQVITDKVEAMLSKFTRSTSWEEDFQEMVDSYSEIRLGYTSKRIVCEACGRRNAITTETIEFQGTLYDTKTYEEISNRSSDERLSMRKVFLIGSHCSNRIEMYHLLRHYMYNLFALCKEKVNKEIVLDARRKRRLSTNIEKDLKEIASEKNEWAKDQYFMFQKDLERANNQRAGLDWGFEK